MEIDVESLKRNSQSRVVRNNVEEFVLDGKRIYLIAEGRLVNLAAGDGHPIEVMDMSFSNQALCIRYIAENDLIPGVYDVPAEIDEHVATLKLASLGIEIDKLTPEQMRYISEWRMGT